MTTIKTIANFIQVSILVTSSLIFSEPAKAQQQSDFVQCKSFHITENYEPGGLNSKGIYERGSVRTTRRRIPCTNAGWESAHYSHHHHAPVPYGYGYPQQQYQQQYQQQQPVQNRPPVVVNVPQNQCQGKLLRMGLGAVGGGFAGRYAVGGKKSNKTVLGTTLGAVAGSLLGRVTC